MNKNNRLENSSGGGGDAAIALAQRTVPQTAARALEQQGVHPVLAGLLAARGVTQRQEFEGGLADLLPPSQLKGIDDAACLLADAIAAGRRMVIVADYDCDGATACAIGMRALRALIEAVGSHASPATSVGYLVPDRFRFGYGLTPPIVELAARDGAQLLITVDNGIASIEGVAHAEALGLQLASQLVGQLGRQEAGLFHRLATAARLPVVATSRRAGPWGAPPADGPGPQKGSRACSSGSTGTAGAATCCSNSTLAANSASRG
jgi:hypothetical protein